MSEYMEDLYRDLLNTELSLLDTRHELDKVFEELQVVTAERDAAEAVIARLTEQLQDMSEEKEALKQSLQLYGISGPKPAQAYYGRDDLD